VPKGGGALVAANACGVQNNDGGGACNTGGGEIGENSAANQRIVKPAKSAKAEEIGNSESRRRAVWRLETRLAKIKA